MIKFCCFFQKFITNQTLVDIWSPNSCFYMFFIFQVVHESNEGARKMERTEEMYYIQKTMTFKTKVILSQILIKLNLSLYQDNIFPRDFNSKLHLVQLDIRISYKQQLKLYRNWKTKLVLKVLKLS